jgi:hypothetical protein
VPRECVEANLQAQGPSRCSWKRHLLILADGRELAAAAAARDVSVPAAAAAASPTADRVATTLDIPSRPRPAMRR